VQPTSRAKSLRAQPDGKVIITDGPYIETKEHVGGFWVLEAADLDEALAWGRKAAVACRAPVEVCARLTEGGQTEATERKWQHCRRCRPDGQNHIGLERNSVMRKINVLEFVSLDGVIQAPGEPEEDTSGPPWWIRSHSAPVSSAVVKKRMNMPFDLLLGRRTFELWAQF